MKSNLEDLRNPPEKFTWYDCSVPRHFVVTGIGL